MCLPIDRLIRPGFVIKRNATCRPTSDPRSNDASQMLHVIPHRAGLQSPRGSDRRHRRNKQLCAGGNK